MGSAPMELIFECMGGEGGRDRASTQDGCVSQVMGRTCHGETKGQVSGQWAPVVAGQEASKCLIEKETFEHRPRESQRGSHAMQERGFQAEARPSARPSWQRDHAQPCPYDSPPTGHRIRPLIPAGVITVPALGHRGLQCMCVWGDFLLRVEKVTFPCGPEAATAVSPPRGELV